MGGLATESFFFIIVGLGFGGSSASEVMTSLPAHTVSGAAVAAVAVVAAVASVKLCEYLANRTAP
jgi:hypothetical protein